MQARRGEYGECAGVPQYAGQYRLESVLGSGGMGVVHLATSASGLKLAVKIVHAEHAVDPEFRARFRQEIAAARLVSGAFTAPVVDADPDAERPWMATLFIDGPTLAERVRERVLEPAEVGRLGAGLAEALRDIHRAGVVHRDLKPSNVLMAADGAKVIDFGISRPYDSDLRTETGKLIGTPPFMAPEQFQRPREVGPAADVFALGAVLVHAATGRGPFDSDSPYLVAYQVVHHEPDLTGLPPQLAAIVARCLAKDPTRRPSADQLIAAMRAVAYPTSEETQAFIPQPRRPVGAGGAGEGEVTHRRERPGVDAQDVPPPPPSPPPRPRGWRRRWAWVAGPVAAVLAAGGVAVGAGALAPEDDASRRSGGRPAGQTAPPLQPWAVRLGGAQPQGNQAAACSWQDSALYCSGPSVAAARLDPGNGSVKWSVPAPAAGSSRTAAGGAPQYAGGLVLVVAANSGLLQALDPATGAERWQRKLAQGARVVPAGQRVLVVGGDGGVSALDAATGAQAWTKRIGGVGSVWRGERDGSLYVATPAADGSSTQVAQVDAAGGGTVRELTRTPGQAEPIGVAQGALYLLETDVRSMAVAVVRVELATRAVRVTRLSTPLLQAGASVGSDGVVYAFGAGGSLVAVGSEREEWRLETGVTVASLPVPMAGRVYLAAADGRLLAVDTGAGARRLVGGTEPRMAAGAHTYAATLAAPVVAAGYVYATAPDGSVFAAPEADPAAW